MDHQDGGSEIRPAQCPPEAGNPMLQNLLKEKTWAVMFSVVMFSVSPSRGLWWAPGLGHPLVTRLSS